MVEVKLTDQEDVDAAAAKLIKIANDIDEEKNWQTSFLMVVTKDIAALKREDGVYEVPLACLNHRPAVACIAFVFNAHDENEIYHARTPSFSSPKGHTLLK